MSAAREGRGRALPLLHVHRGAGRVLCRFFAWTEGAPRVADAFTLVALLFGAWVLVVAAAPAFGVLDPRMETAWYVPLVGLLALAVIFILHEAAHAGTCIAHGGEAANMGIQWVGGLQFYAEIRGLTRMPFRSAARTLLAGVRLNTWALSILGLGFFMLRGTLPTVAAGLAFAAWWLAFSTAFTLIPYRMNDMALLLGRWADVRNLPATLAEQGRLYWAYRFGRISKQAFVGYYARYGSRERALKMVRLSYLFAASKLAAFVTALLFAHYLGVFHALRILLAAPTARAVVVLIAGLIIMGAGLVPFMVRTLRRTAAQPKPTQ